MLSNPQIFYVCHQTNKQKTKQKTKKTTRTEAMKLQQCIDLFGNIYAYSTFWWLQKMDLNSHWIGIDRSGKNAGSCIFPTLLSGLENRQNGKLLARKFCDLEGKINKIYKGKPSHTGGKAHAGWKFCPACREIFFFQACRLCYIGVGKI